MNHNLPASARTDELQPGDQIRHPEVNPLPTQEPPR